MAAIERYPVLWYVHIDRHGSVQDFDAGLAYMQRQPARWRDAVVVIGEITNTDGVALLSGYLRLDGRGLLGDVTPAEATVRFTQVWANLDDVWRRISSRTSARTSVSEVASPR